MSARETWSRRDLLKTASAATLSALAAGYHSPSEWRHSLRHLFRTNQRGKPPRITSPTRQLHSFCDHHGTLTALVRQWMGLGILFGIPLNADGGAKY